MLRLKYHLIILSALLSNCQSCKKYNVTTVKKEKEDEIEGENTFKSIQDTRNEIIKKRNEVNEYWKKPKKTYYDLVHIRRDIQDIIDRAYEKAEKLNNMPLTGTELILLEKLVIEAGKLEEIEEDLREEYESWADNLVEIFNIPSEEVETYIQWIYKPNPEGNFLIHKWAYEEIYSIDSFILEKTVDINCKNKDGLTALQIVTKAILTGENNDKRTDDIEKLELLLYSGADVNVIPHHDITALLNLVRSDYPEKDKLISILRRHADT